MGLTDGKIEESEMLFTKELAFKTGFKEDEIPALVELLINGIRGGGVEEDLFNQNKKQRVV